MRIGLLVTGLIAGLGVSISSASALPVRGQMASGGESPVLVEKVHGWHSHCVRGPAHYHRHIPGAGNVSCVGPRAYYAPRVYVGPRVVVVPRHHHRRRFY